MRQEEKLRGLIRRDLQRGPAGQPSIGPILEGARRRRNVRRLAYGGLAAVLAAGLVLPLALLGLLGGGIVAPTAGGTLERFGIHVRLPEGWEGRFYLSPGRGPVLMAANFPMMFRPPDSVTAAHPLAPYFPASLEGAGPDGVVVSLFEYPPDHLSPSDGAFPPLQHRLSIAGRDIKPCALMREGCVKRYLSLNERNFLLLGTFATVEGAAAGGVAVGHVRVVPEAALEEANTLLGSLTVDASGFELGLSCRPHGTDLHLSTTTGGILGWSPPCLAAPAGRELTIHFENRLTAESGQAGLAANVELYPNEVFAYSVDDQSYAWGPLNRQHAAFIGDDVESPGTAVYHVPPLRPGVYYMTGRAGDPNRMTGVLIVTG